MRCDRPALELGMELAGDEVRMAAILPSTRRDPNPPGTKMPALLGGGADGGIEVDGKRVFLEELGIRLRGGEKPGGGRHR